jgi:hypothetical protein
LIPDDYRSKVQAAGIGPSAQCITAVDASGNVTATDICTSHLDTAIHRWDLLANGYADMAPRPLLEPEPA